MPESFCPECDGKIRLNSSPRKGDRVTCPICGAYLMVASSSPIELDWAYDDEDDEDFDEEIEYEEYEFDD